MGFKKGEPRPENAGRKKSTPNKVTTITRGLITQLSADTYDEFRTRMMNLDDDKFCATWLKMQEYVLPKLSSQEVTVTEESNDGLKILRELAQQEYKKQKAEKF